MKHDRETRIMNITPEIENRIARIDARHSSGGVWQDGRYRSLGSIGTTSRILTRNELRHCAPSVFAEAAHSRTSDRYSFLPTASILDGMESQGWVPTACQEQNVRDEGREGFQKHMIRFAHRDDLQKQSAERPEIVLINAHDRSSSYHLHCGIFRSYCLNGLVVCDATFEKRSITHMGFEPGKVIDATMEIIRDVPALMDGIAEMKTLALTDSEQRFFAESAAIVRWEELAKAPVSADKLLTLRRREDSGGSLWETLNVVQENLIKGGQKDFNKRKPDGSRMPRTRAVKGIDGNVSLNKALWHLAEQMKMMKA